MKLPAPLRIFNPRYLYGRIFLFFWLPVFALVTIPAILVFCRQNMLLRDSIHDGMQYHNSAIVTRVNSYLSSYEVVLKSQVFRTEVQQTLLGAEMKDVPRAVEVIKKVHNEITGLLPNVVHVYVALGDKPITIAPPPPDSDLADEVTAREILLCHNNINDGFCWTRPFFWRPGVPAVSVFWRITHGTTRNSLGIVLPLDSLTKGTLDIAYSLSNISGALIVDRLSGIPWGFPDPNSHPVSSVFSSSNTSFTNSSAFTDYIKSVQNEPSSESIFLDNDSKYYSFVNSLSSGDLCLALLFNASLVDLAVERQYLAQSLFLLFVWLLLVFLVAMFHRALASVFGELTIGVRTIRQQNDMSYIPTALPEEAMPLWNELDEFARESYLQAIFYDERAAAYNIAVQKTRELIQAIPEGYTLTREDGTVVECNGALLKLTGYNLDELMNTKLSRLVEKIPRNPQDEVGEGGFSPPQVMLRNASGELIPISIIEKPIALGYDNFILCLVRDISREEELRKSVLKLTTELESYKMDATKEVERYRFLNRDLIKRMLEGVIRLDGAGNIVYCNPSASTLFAYPAPEELIGVNIFSSLKFTDTVEFGIGHFLHGNAESRACSITFTRFDGSRGSAYTLCRWLGEFEGGFAEVLLADTSETDDLRHELARYRRESETILLQHEGELRRTQKQLIDHAHRAGMAEVASEVLHNIGNAVNSIGVRLEEIAKIIRTENIPERLKMVASRTNGTAGEDNSQIGTYISSLAQAVTSSRQGLEQNIAFIREKLLHITEIISLHAAIASIRGIIEQINVADLILDAVEMNRETMNKRKIIVRYQFGTVPQVRVEKNKLLQVLVNLIKNAIEAIDSVETDRREMDIEIGFINENRMVEIKVTDSGIGFSKDISAQLFGFGFTTRKVKGGSGFGLHSSFNLMKAMGGSIRAHSEGIGKGAIFVVLLPIEPPLDDIIEVT